MMNEYEKYLTLAKIPQSQLQKYGIQDSPDNWVKKGNQLLKEDLESAIDYYQKAAKKNQPQAWFALGICHQYGKGLQKNQNMANECYMKGLELMVADAGKAMGIAKVTLDIGLADKATAMEAAANRKRTHGEELYLTGKRLVDEKKYHEAYQWLLNAAEEGNVPAQTELGKMYYYGRSRAVNYKTAVKWFRGAAEQMLVSSAEAQYLLGRCYYSGEGVPMDRKEAQKWITLAAESGYKKAEIFLKKF